MNDDNTYHARVVWDGEHWLAEVNDLPGAHTYAKTIATLRKRLREVVVLMDDRPDRDLDDPDAFHVSLDYAMTVTESVAAAPMPKARVASTSLAKLLEALEYRAAARDEYDRLGDELARRTREAVASAREMGISLRDTAEMLDLSFQRVDQIEKETRKGSRHVTSAPRTT